MQRETYRLGLYCLFLHTFILELKSVGDRNALYGPSNVSFSFYGEDKNIIYFFSTPIDAELFIIIQNKHDHRHLKTVHILFPRIY